MINLYATFMMIKKNYKKIITCLLLSALMAFPTSFSCFADDDDDEPELFPITKRLFRNGGGGGGDPAAAIVSIVTVTFAVVFDIITSSSQLTLHGKSKKKSHKEQIQTHAASWNNPKSMMANSILTQQSK